MKACCYTTVGTAGEAKLVIRKSTFLSFAVPVWTTGDVEERIRDFRKKFYDARHICYAYVLEPDGSVARGSDNGEPSGTAGRPILGVIRSAGLTGVLVVVVRYFGGIKLGTGGLAAAYKEAAEEAVGKAAHVSRPVEDRIAFAYDYARINAVMKLLKAAGARIETNSIDMLCRTCITVTADKTEGLRAQLLKVPSLKIDDNG